MPGLAAFGIGSALSAIGGGIQTGINYKLAKKQFKWQKEVQRETWDREDNAAQRRAADLSAAGLSKTLAAGSAASSGPVVSTQAPKMEGIPETVQNAYQLLTQGAIYEKTRMDTKASEMQAEKLGAEADLARQKGRLEKHDADIMQNKPFLYKNPSMVGSITRDVVNAGKPAIKALKKIPGWYQRNIGQPFEKGVRRLIKKVKGGK